MTSLPHRGAPSCLFRAFRASSPAAVFFYSPDRGGEHPEHHLASYAGLMQADAYAGFNRLYEANRRPAGVPLPSKR